MGGRRLTAAWVRYQDGCTLISLLVIRTTPFRFLCLVRILALFPFSFLFGTALYSSYLDFRVCLSGLHNNALGLREFLSRLGLHNNALGLRETLSRLGLHNNAIGLRETPSRLGLHNNALDLREIPSRLSLHNMPFVCLCLLSYTLI